MGKQNSETRFETFMTIKLGSGLKTTDDFRKALAENKCRISILANDILLGQPGFTVANQETKVELVVVSVAELGFKEGAKYADICKRSGQLGLELCPAEVGPQLGIQYKNQPLSEWLRIAMEPITDSEGIHAFWVLLDSDGLWLDSNVANPNDFWTHKRQWVFVRSK